MSNGVRVHRAPALELAEVRADDRQCCVGLVVEDEVPSVLDHLEARVGGVVEHRALVFGSQNRVAAPCEEEDLGRPLVRVFSKVEACARLEHLRGTPSPCPRVLRDRSIPEGSRGGALGS